MRKTPAGNPKLPPGEKVPPGGRALERVRQDRAARGLGAPVEPGGSLVLDDGDPSTKGQPTVKPTKKAGKRKQP